MMDEKLKSPPRPSDSLKKILAANFAGTFWQALMGLIFLPLYIRYIGIESFGLIAIFGTLQVVFGLLDVGLSNTLTREMARLSVLPNKEQETRNLVRTLETLYWGIAVLVGIGVVSMSPIITHQWVKPGELNPKTIEQSFLIMGLVTVFQMPIGFYSGGLMGLQKQVLLNVINIFTSTLRGVGAVFVLGLVSPTIQAFLLWQLGISISNALIVALFLWGNLPRSEDKAVFQAPLLKNVWRFTAGISGITILSVILTQVDKIVLSKLLSLEMFGYYSLASSVAMSLTRIYTPLFYSFYPRFIQLVSVNDLEELKRFYHKSCQLMAVFILPVAVVISMFSYEVILLWTQNPTTAEKTHLIVSIMIFGTALNGLMNPPYALQLAFGWTQLPFYANLISVIVLMPLLVFIVPFLGAIGGAYAWLVLNIGYVVFWIPVMHKRLLVKEKWRWYWQDVCIPLMMCTFFAGLGRFIVGEQLSRYATAVALIIVSVVTLGVTASITPVTRSWLFGQFMRLKLVSETK